MLLFKIFIDIRFPVRVQGIQFLKNSAGKNREETHDKPKEVLRDRNFHDSHHPRRVGNAPGVRETRLKPETSADPLFHPVRPISSAFRSPRNPHLRTGTFLRTLPPLRRAPHLRAPLRVRPGPASRPRRGLRSWLAVRWTRTAALNLTPPSSFGLLRPWRTPLRGRF